MTSGADQPKTAYRPGRYSPAGIGVGGMLLAASLVPALLPRPWLVQGVVSGIAVAVGYRLGSGGAALLHRFLPISRLRAWMRVAALIAPAMLVVWVLVVHTLWRIDIAALMDTDLPLIPYIPFVLLTALTVGFLLIQLSRGVRTVLAWYRGRLTKVVPGWLAATVTALTCVITVTLFFDLVIGGQLVPALEEAHRESDRRFEPGVSPPRSSSLAGGPGSLIDWETMGSQGRAFVAQTPTSEELEAFSGVPPLEPVRIYVGLETAADSKERAGLAVEEMERAGAFERKVIVLIAPTGSGWIDPYALDGLEYMYNGDTAAVALQYSYLASWMVMIGNQDLAVDAARSLLTAVMGRLDQKPEEGRPMLLLYGESLGAFGWERLFNGLDEVTATVDGALWVGPPRSGPLWQRLVADRDPGSPVWRPVYQGGETVRFGADGEALDAAGERWDQPRLAYLQHASDPITWWSPDIIVHRPEWLDPPRGSDVSEHMPYIPVVTWWQMAVDLAVGTNAPLGHGHKFGSAQAEAWARILPPSGWTEAHTEKLAAVFQE